MIILRNIELRHEDLLSKDINFGYLFLEEIFK